MRPGGRSGGERFGFFFVSVRIRARLKGREGRRRVKLKEAKGQIQGGLICETGAMEGYLKGISQSGGGGENSLMGARQ